MTLNQKKQMLLALRNTLEQHGDTPANLDDINHLLSLVLDVIPRCKQEHKRLEVSVSMAYVKIFDVLMSHDHLRPFFTSSMSAPNRTKYVP